MTSRSIQDILPLVEQPSRYLGSEINSVRKDLGSIRLRMVLAFPELYEIGTSHFGIQILYSILNGQQEIAAERVFCPARDMKTQLKASGIPLVSLETHTPIHDFDIIGFSLLYELNYTNVLSMLDLGNIPFFSTERDATYPIVIAGGPCTCNPEPVAEVFDAIVIGDGELVILEMAQIWMDWKTRASNDKTPLLKEWSRITGVYVPSLFQQQRSDSDYQSVQRAIVKDLDSTSFPESPIVPYGRPVHDRLRLEIARGCTRSCRFCQAGMIYRPVRERSPETLLSLAGASLATTGYEDISLLSLSTGDYRCISPLVKQLMARGRYDHTAISLPSLRVETLTPELMVLIKEVRKTGFTIAPEAGSQRLRDMINKHISEREIFETVGDAFRLGWQVIKLYFMIGFPSETEQDLLAMVDLIRRLRKIKGPTGRKDNLNVSVATFIPKPHTPFQWASQNSLGESREKIEWLKQQLKMPGVHFKWQNPEISILEGLWARGDRRLNRLLTAAYRRGCEFDGWSDSFDYHSWESALSEAKIALDDYTIRERDPMAPLPWDHIETGISKEFLQREWQNALSGRFTPDCRDGECQDCGVCDFREIAPIVHTSCENESSSKEIHSSDNLSEYKKVRFSYSKLDDARYFGHLEMVNIFIRAFKRSDVPLRYTEGFHPKPKISFDDPLPIGIESREAFFLVETPGHLKLLKIINALNIHLPEGLTVFDGKRFSSTADRKGPIAVSYSISTKEDLFDGINVERFNEKDQFLMTRISRKGKERTFDLKDVVLRIERQSPRRLLLTLKSTPGATLRPSDVICPVFDISKTALALARIVKTKTRPIPKDPP